MMNNSGILIGTLRDLRIDASIPTPRLAQVVDADAMTFGLKHSLVTASDCVRLSLQRLKMGHRLTDLEERTALALSDDLRAVEDALWTRTLSDASRARAERYWCAVTFDVLLSQWETYDFPESEALELNIGWGSDTAFNSILRAGRTWHERRTPIQVGLCGVLEREIAEISGLPS